MLDEAHQLLGVSPDADGRAIEAAYWQRAHELAQDRTRNPEAAEELDRVNWAYQQLSADRISRPRRPPPVRRSSLIRRFAMAATAALVIAGASFAGIGYRAEIKDSAARGIEHAQEGWDETITWLQSIDAEPTPEAPDSTTR